MQKMNADNPLVRRILCVTSNILFLVSTMLISGCAELSAINDKVGDWAGQMNQTLYGSKDGSVEQHNGRQVYTKTRNGKYVYQDSGTL